MKLIESNNDEWIKIGDYIAHRQPESYEKPIKMGKVKETKRDVTEEITRAGEVEERLQSLKRLMEEKQGVNML